MPETTSPAIAVEVRMKGGIYALNRFFMTLQNKRMPVKNLDVNMGESETEARLLFDCPRENARRYMSLLEMLEDVDEVWESESRSR